MIVFDLHCDHGHVFEAWFGSSQDYETQRARHLILCPLCDSHEVAKAPMAPAVPAKSNQRADSAETAPVVQAGATGDPATMKALMEAMTEYQRKVEDNCDWVGDRFAEEARALHFGESTRERGIYGEASLDDARALAEDGIEIAPLPFRAKKASDA